MVILSNCRLDAVYKYWSTAPNKIAFINPAMFTKQISVTFKNNVKYSYLDAIQPAPMFDIGLSRFSWALEESKHSVIMSRLVG